MIYFYSDPHFGHDNIIKYTNRPFKDVYEMNRILVENWNAVIQPDDTVIMGGDIFFGSHEFAIQILHRLTGKKILCFGNHDKPMRNAGVLKFFENFNELINMDKRTINTREVMLRELNDPEVTDDQPIVVSHFPIEIWPRKHHGSWHLHGHSHGKLPWRLGMEARIDISVDCWGFAPVSYYTIKSTIQRRIAGLERPPNT